MSSRRYFETVVGGLLLGCAVVLLLPGIAEACPTCRDGVNNDPNAVNLRNGYMWSICFMMSMPFLIFGSLGGYLYYEVRKARRQSVNNASAAKE